MARLGGDEFAVLHVGTLEDEAIFDKAEQIVATICQPLGVEGLLLTCGPAWVWPFPCQTAMTPRGCYATPT